MVAAANQLMWLWLFYNIYTPVRLEINRKGLKTVWTCGWLLRKLAMWLKHHASIFIFRPIRNSSALSSGLEMRLIHKFKPYRHRLQCKVMASGESSFSLSGTQPRWYVVGQVTHEIYKIKKKEFLIESWPLNSFAKDEDSSFRSHMRCVH